MKILFLHNNFPAQFGAFAGFLARKGWNVTFGTQRSGVRAQGMGVFNYAPHRTVTEKIHPYAVGFERAVIAGQAVARAALKLKNDGYIPDIIMAHSGWGPGLFVKDVWPTAKYIGFFEWYYRADAPDVVFLDDGERDLDNQLRAQTRNAAILMDLAQCDGAICPTEFQRAQFPTCFGSLLNVVHDGIDTQYYSPDPHAQLSLDGHDFTGAREFVTYVARGMELYRGFPEFMKALEIILARRPGAHAIILGEDRIAYGKQLAKGDSYKKRALNECDLDWSRVHFTGLLPRPDYLRVLQASSVHIYLTVPFVLSWSMMEAMSAGCAIVASDVAPVREIYEKEDGALALAAHARPEDIAEKTIVLLEDEARRKTLGENARALIEKHYDARDIFPSKMDWLRSL